MAFLNKLKDIFSFGNVLYYPGCLTKFAAPDLEKNYKQILDMMNIDYIEIPDFYCCGSPVIKAGYDADFQNLIDKNAEVFRKYSIKKIITGCPSCSVIFKKYYDIRVEHIIITIAKNLDKIKARHEGDITYHDPCHLGRKGNIYNAPRKILTHLGFNLVEMKDNKENSMCCGAGGGLKSNAPKLSNKIAKLRLKQVKTKKLVTTCAMCYLHLKENAKGIEVMELSQLLVKNGKTTKKTP